MYADVVMNGVEVNLALRASSEKEARTKLETFPEYRGVSQILDISPNVPRRQEEEKEDENTIPLVRNRGKNHWAKLYTGGKLHTY
jgi:hypothetical protein